MDGVEEILLCVGVFLVGGGGRCLFVVFSYLTSNFAWYSTKEGHILFPVIWRSKFHVSTQIVIEEIRCHHFMGYSFRLAARNL